ncbi:hypothetical protein GCM10010228_77890 [Streptomyces massasporeus]|nr:hypothetical protein GCM10010228_77890 [Streptomyces massasporeus]
MGADRAVAPGSDAAAGWPVAGSPSGDDAIAWKFQTGSQWVHLPEKLGNWREVYNRLRMWAVDGTWERVFTALVVQADAEEDLSWAVSVDSTIVRAPARGRGPERGGQPVNLQTMPSVGPAAG